MFNWTPSENPTETFEQWATECRQLCASARKTSAHRTAAGAGGSSPRIPTPTAGDAKASGSRNLEGSKAHAGVSLTDWVRFGNSTTARLPTPTAARYGNNQGGASPDGPVRMSLDSMAAQGRWPSPAARDWKWPNKKPYRERGGGTKGEQLPNAVGGPLNPTWVEWLMGFPLGHTDSRRSGTRRSPRWLRLHSEP
jgi:hypothetical protein